MRILFDLTYISTKDSYAGISVFSYSLIPALLKYGAGEVEIIGLARSSTISMLAERLPGVEMAEIAYKDFRKFRGINGFLNKRALDRVVRERGADLFFLPFVSDRCLWTHSVPMAAVMHDAQGFKIAKPPLRALVYDTLTPFYASRADVLVTISNFAREDIRRTVPKLKSKPMEVIYQSLCFPRMEERATPADNPPYILSVNTIQPYKNPMTIIRAFQRILDRIPHELWLKGLKSSYSEEVVRPYIASNSLDGRVKILDEVYTPAQMDVLFSKASLFVSGSTMEGFGLTPIESAMHLVPAVCADIPVVMETTRGLLRYYSPVFDDEALSREMLDALEHPQDMRAVAREYESFYSPERQARAYIALFKRMLDGRPAAGSDTGK